jgi:phosphoribosylaminoimidazolecarboxamide formyltransferase/IMP cyclohydrolase
MRRALISVYDKTGVVEFAKKLQNIGFELIASEGTQKTLQDGGVNGITAVSELTGFTEFLDGRVKTLHPKLVASILAQKNNEDHMKQLEQLETIPIDLVVCNLYPFKEVTDQPQVSLQTAIENIDIGGSTLIRAAAKNFENVTVVVNPHRYNMVLKEYKKYGDVTTKTRKTLAVEAFKTTTKHDLAVYRFLRKVTTV